jgi:hypothetical protein
VANSRPNLTNVNTAPRRRITETALRRIHAKAGHGAGVGAFSLLGVILLEAWEW